MRCVRRAGDAYQCGRRARAHSVPDVEALALGGRVSRARRGTAPRRRCREAPRRAPPGPRRTARVRRLRHCGRHGPAHRFYVILYQRRYLICLEKEMQQFIDWVFDG